VTEEDMQEILNVDIEGWKREIADVRSNHYPKFGDKLPKELYAELDAIEKRLGM
jgi:phosphoenolpyruvate carboxykinase (GTP)